MMEEVNEERKAPPTTAPAKVAVRYGYMSFVGEFEYHGSQRLTPEQAVLVETDRGLELGWFLCYLTKVAEGLVVGSSEIASYLQNSGEGYLKERAGRVVRAATAQDLREYAHIQADAGTKKQFCQEMAERLGLKMQVACVEHLFGGERIVFYFTAEGRVDFRELVRDLAREYQTRIELRQIGARDEARLLADYEICGRQCCCKNFLKILRPVNMKMAKLQKATLDPSKVSGRCGRLRCCLAFEHACYEDLASRLPKVGSWVQTRQGVGRVRERQILTQLVAVVLEGNRVVAIPAEEVSPARPPERQEETEAEAGEGAALAEDSEGDGEVTDLKAEEERDGESGGSRDGSPQGPSSSAEDGSGRKRGRRSRRPRR